jgi:hypothetical protein
MVLALGACANAVSREALEQPLVESRHLAIRFDNDARDYVHVYLVSDRRQWLLGRVEPGAMAALRMPDEALEDDVGPVKLVVIAGGRVTFQAARDPRATLAMAQTTESIVSQQWRFTQGQLTPLMLLGPRATVLQ